MLLYCSCLEWKLLFKNKRAAHREHTQKIPVHDKLISQWNIKPFCIHQKN